MTFRHRLNLRLPVAMHTTRIWVEVGAVAAGIVFELGRKYLSVAFEHLMYLFLLTLQVLIHHTLVPLLDGFITRSVVCQRSKRQRTGFIITGYGVPILEPK